MDLHPFPDEWNKSTTQAVLSMMWDISSLADMGI
jgi:hypothetical protein